MSLQKQQKNNRMVIIKRQINRNEKKEHTSFLQHTRAPSSGKFDKIYFLQTQQLISENLWMEHDRGKVFRYFLTIVEYVALVRQNY